MWTILGISSNYAMYNEGLFFCLLNCIEVSDRRTDSSLIIVRVHGNFQNTVLHNCGHLHVVNIRQKQLLLNDLLFACKFVRSASGIAVFFLYQGSYSQFTKLLFRITLLLILIRTEIKQAFLHEFNCSYQRKSWQ